MTERLRTQTASDVVDVQDDVTLRPKGSFGNSSGIYNPPVTPPIISCTGATESISISLDLQYYTEGVSQETTTDHINWRVEIDGVLKPNNIGPTTNSYLEEYLINNQDAFGITGTFTGGNPSYLTVSHYSGSNHRVRLIPDRTDWDKHADFLNFSGNPTVEFNPTTKVISFCLSGSGTGPVDPEPSTGLVPDFAVFAKNVTGNVSDNLGNYFNGALRQMSVSPMEGIFATMMAIVPTNAITDSYFDTDAEVIHLALGIQVLPGDYVESYTWCSYAGGTINARTSQTPILGTDVENGYIGIPYNECLTGDFSNATVNATLTIKRGRVANDTIVIGDPVTISAEARYRPQELSSVFSLNNKMHIGLFKAPDGTANRMGEFAIPISQTGNDLIFDALGAPIVIDNSFQYAMNTRKFMYTIEPDIGGNNPALARLRILNRITNDERIAVLNIAYSDYWGQYGWAVKEGKVFINDDGSIVSIEARNEYSLVRQVFYSAVWDGSAYIKSDVPTDPNWSNFNPLLRESFIRSNDGSRIAPYWYLQGDKFATVTSVGASTLDNPTSGDYATQNIPTLYNIDSRETTGAHVLSIDPSNASLLQVLEDHKVFNVQNRNGVASTYNYRFFKGSNLCMAYPYSNVPNYCPDTLLFKRTGNVWSLFKVFRRIGSGASVVQGVYDSSYIVNLPADTILDYATLGLDGVEDKFMITWAVKTGMTLKSDLGNTVVDFQILNLDTGEISRPMIGE